MTSDDAKSRGQHDRPGGCECELGGVWGDGGPCLACKKAGYTTPNPEYEDDE